MEITVKITDFNEEILKDLKVRLGFELNRIIAERIKTIDIDKIIHDTVEYRISNNMYVSDKMIKDFVQEKIARILKEKIDEPNIQILTPRKQPPTDEIQC